MIPMRIKDGEIEVFAKYKEEREFKYHFPGGGWDPNEDPQDAAIREAQEENVKLNIDHRMVFFKRTYVFHRSFLLCESCLSFATKL